MKKFFSFFAALLFAGSMMAATYVPFSGALVEGDYLITYDGAAMNNTVSSDRLQATTLTLTDGTVVDPAASIVWHIAKSGDYWTIYNADVQKYAAGTGAKNKAQLLASGTDDKSLWTVSGTETYDFVNKANAAASVNSTLRKNGTYGFACYATSTGGALTLYKLQEGPAPAVAAPIISGETNFFDSTIVTINCATTGATVYYTLDGTTPDAQSAVYANPFKLTASATVKAVASNGELWSDAVAKTFTKAPEFASFEALIAAGVADKTLVKVSFENIKIDSIYTSSQNKRQGIYFTVGETAYEIYYSKAEVPETWEVNGTVSGTICGNWTLYAKANIWEIVPSATDWNWNLNYTAPEPIGAPEYYVVGSMTGWVTDAAWKLEANPGKEGEYLGEFTFAAGDQLKVVGVVGNVTTWYPGGETPNYTINNAGKCVVYFRPDGQGGDDWYYGYFNVIMLEPIVSPYVYSWAENIGTTILGNSDETVGTVKIHTNTDDVDCIKFAKSYVYADGKYVAIKPAEGAFKAGDTLKVAVCFNNSDATKYCMVDVYAADAETRLWRSDSATTINGRTSAADPAIQTYVLAADQDSLLLGRYGNTTMCVTLLQVVKGEAPVVEPVYTVVGSSAPLFTNTWEPAYEANDMNHITGSEYLYAWKKENVALTAGTIEYKVCQNHGWNPSWPASGNFSFNIAEAGLYDVTIFFNPELETPTQVVAEFKGAVVVLPNIILHGNFSGSWADTEAFTPAVDSLTASLELALTAGIYEFGFKFDGNWKANGAQLTREANTTNLAEGSGNMFVTADVPGNYIFTYTYATQAVEVTYPNPIIVPDTFAIEISSVTAPGALIWTDYVAEEGWWQIMGANENYEFSISNVSTTEAPGVYTVDDLDADYTYLTVMTETDTTDLTLVSGSITIAVDDNNVVTAIGEFVASDNNVYKFNLTYVDPTAETLVEVTISNGELADDYASYGLYGVAGFDDNMVAYVQLGIWAENGFQGNFSEDDLDLRYIGSYVYDATGYSRIFTAAIEVIPADTEGGYLITANLLCYNNTLYKVTMTIPAAQGLEGVEAAKKAIKSLVNGMLVIEKAGKAYNANGVVIR